MDKEREVWFAMRATYRREMKARQLLESNGIDSFVPMRYGSVLRGGRRQKRLVPAIHNLIFVRASWQRLKDVKSKAPYLQYIIREDEQKQRHALVVPDWQMENFIRLAQTFSEQLVYVEPRFQQWKKGQKVRITEGPFQGQEGEFVKVAGIKGKSVVVSIAGVVAVAITTVPAASVEAVEGKEAETKTKKDKRLQNIR